MNHFQNSIEHQQNTGVYNLTVVNSMWHYIETEQVNIVDLTHYYDKIKNDLLSLQIPVFDINLEVTIILEVVMLAKVDSCLPMALEYITDELDSVYNQNNLLTVHLLNYLNSEQFIHILYAIDTHVTTIYHLPYKWLTPCVLATKEVIFDEAL